MPLHISIMFVPHSRVLSAYRNFNPSPSKFSSQALDEAYLEDFESWGIAYYFGGLPKVSEPWPVTRTVTCILQPYLPDSEV